MPLNAWSADVRLGETTESGLYIDYLLKGQSYVVPENGYFVNEPWMEMNDEDQILLDEYETELEKPSLALEGRLLMVAVGVLIGAFAGR